MLYLSIVNVGQVFYGFGWESLLLEAGFLAIFLGPVWMEPSLLLIVLVRWLLIRVELGAGLIKLRGDPCWRSLTCLRYHHETQPLPGPFSWHFTTCPTASTASRSPPTTLAQLLAPLALLLAAAAFHDGALGLVVPASAPELVPPPLWYHVLALVVTGVVLVLSWQPVRNMASSHQRMNASFA